LRGTSVNSVGTCNHEKNMTEALKPLTSYFHSTGLVLLNGKDALGLAPRLLAEEAKALTDHQYATLVGSVIRSLRVRDLSLKERRQLLERVINYHKADLRGDQPRAFDKILTWVQSREEGSYFQLKGYAGSGKTHLARKIPDIHELAKLLGGENYTFEYCAPTHKAKNVLSKSLNKPARTIYSFLKLKMSEGDSEDKELVETAGRDTLLASQNVMVMCDEMSMLNEVVVNSLKKKTSLYDLRSILMGDPAQLNPVGEDFSEAFSLPGPKVMMKEILRSNNTLVGLSVQVRANDYNFKATDDIHLCRGSTFRQAILENYDQETCRVLAWRNKTVDAYNKIIRSHLGRGDELEPDDIVSLGSPVLSEYGNQILANTGDEFLVSSVQVQAATFNSIYNQAVVTSEGMILPAPSGISIPPLHVKRVELDELAQDVFMPVDPEAFQSLLSKLADLCRSKQFHWKHFWTIKNAFTPLKYAYAQTVHQSQGSTMSRVFVDVPDIMANSDEREMQACLYVAVTRPSHDIFLRQ